MSETYRPGRLDMPDWGVSTLTISLMSEVQAPQHVPASQFVMIWRKDWPCCAISRILRSETPLQIQTITVGLGSLGSTVADPKNHALIEKGSQQVFENDSQKLSD
jgi:hypothetical protein